MTNGFTGVCVGNSGSVPRLGFKGLCFEDAPAGIRGPDFVSAFPAGMHLGQTWDKTLMRAYGKALGEEYHGKGVNVALGPVGGGIGRVTRAGRNWEGPGPDPYLTGEQMEAIVLGIQGEGVIACSKVRSNRFPIFPIPHIGVHVILTYTHSTGSSTNKNTDGSPAPSENPCPLTSTTPQSTNCTPGRS